MARAVRWDVVAVAAALIAAVMLLASLGTGALAGWTSGSSPGRLSVSLVALCVGACGVAVIAMWQWLHAQRVVGRSAVPPTRTLAAAADIRRSMHRDAVGVGVGVVVAAVSLAFVDQGSVGAWLGRQSAVRIDALVAISAALVVGLAFFSLRRWTALSRHLVATAELSLTTSQLNREAGLLSELSDLLQSCRSLDEAYALIAERTQLLFPTFSGAVCMIAASRDVVDVAVSWGAPLMTNAFFQPSDCWALRRGKTHLLDADPTHIRCGHIATLRPSRAACVPMMAHGEAIGVLYLDRVSVAGASDEQQLTWTEHEQRLIRLLGEQAALALANLQLRDTLRLQSIRDPLTSLYNRRYLEESLERELRRSARSGSTVGLMMIDVDHFKQLNDTAGHEAGDAVLAAFGAVLRQDLRKEDVVCRYGGEEFTVMLPDASLEATRQRAEVVRESIARTIVQSRGRTLDPVTVSVGIAISPHHGTSGDALLRSADTALYRAKQAGRNRVVVA